MCLVLRLPSLPATFSAQRPGTLAWAWSEFILFSLKERINGCLVNVSAERSEFAEKK